MKNETTNGMTRRSFIKRSTVATIAATNITMFTGLVNALPINPSPFETTLLPPNCSIVKDGVKIPFSVGAGPHEREELLTECWCSDNGVANGSIPCGVWKIFDDNGVEKTELRTQVFVACGSGGNTQTQTVMCWDEEWIQPVDPS